MPVPICKALQHHTYRRIRAPINALRVTSELSEYTSRCMNRIDEVRGFDSLGGRRLACGINAVDREQYHRRHARPAPFRRMDLAAAQHFRAEWIRDVEKGVGRGMGEA